MELEKDCTFGVLDFCSALADEFRKKIGTMYRLVMTVEMQCGMLLDPTVLLIILNYIWTISVTPLQL